MRAHINITGKFEQPPGKCELTLTFAIDAWDLQTGHSVLFKRGLGVSSLRSLTPCNIIPIIVYTCTYAEGVKCLAFSISVFHCVIIQSLKTQVLG